MEIMGFKKFIRYYFMGESLKEIELNRILDKISKKSTLSDKEVNFLDLYNDTKEEDMKDYLYLSKNATFYKLRDLLDKNKQVVCDLFDKNGKIGLKIDNIINDFEDDTCILTLKGGEKHKLHDRFLYNIIYDTKRSEYSLRTQDEFFEKIPVKND
jgi:hypothetical protein